ncbi:MAG: hypothetical protein HY951_08935 [Bacteroidia bacterium]|nr:hypothetical protein [Bacteroidia bacterium]
MKKIVLVSVLLLFLLNCKKENSNEVGTGKIYGKITNIISTEQSANVCLFNSQNVYNVVPTITGEYEILNVLAGNYKLKVSQTTSDGIVERTVSVNVTKSTQEVNVSLPDPVILYCNYHTNSSVALKWTLSIDTGFREYKIYKGYNSGLDETTGTLIHVSTSRADTAYLDTNSTVMGGGISPNSNYYYRVFVMDEMGKIAGSNVLHVLTDSNTFIYNLNLESNFAGHSDLGVINGITFDGSNVWLAYRLDLGGFYDNDKISLVKLDNVNYNIIDTLFFNDRYEPIGGLTFDGSNLWLQYSASGTGSNFIREINPDNGAILNNFNTDYGVWGISYFNSEIYLNYYWLKIEKINPVNGGITSTINTYSNGINSSFGIAVKNDEIWVSNSISDGSIYVLNNNGSLKGFVSNNLDRSQLCFIQNKLFAATPSRVYIYNITAKK